MITLGYSYESFLQKFTFPGGACSLLVEVLLQEWHQHHDGGARNSFRSRYSL